MWMRVVQFGGVVVAAWVISSLLNALSHPWLLALFVIVIAVPLYGSIARFRERKRSSDTPQ